MDALFRLARTVERDPAVEAWFAPGDPFRSMVRGWFDCMRDAGPDVRELLHDGCPVACVEEAPFGYVNAYTSHAAVGFFHGAALADQKGLLEGSGKYMRHVKLRPGTDLDREALRELIAAAYADIGRRLSLARGGT
jgi:hypothetical protein